MIVLGKDSFETKSCESSNFLFTPRPENHHVQNQKNSPLKTQQAKWLKIRKRRPEVDRLDGR